MTLSLKKYDGNEQSKLIPIISKNIAKKRKNVVQFFVGTSFYE